MRASASVGANDLSGLLSGLGTQMNAPRATNALTLLGTDSRFGGPRVTRQRSGLTTRPEYQRLEDVCTQAHELEMPMPPSCR
jgi:hypothetical protein